MQALYIIASFISFIGIISLWFSLNYRQLKTNQKLALILTTLGIVVPMIAGFIDGFLHH